MTEIVQSYLWLIPVGFLIGAYGTLIGAGGGFVLVPLLLLIYPRETPEVIASISLAVVFFNALSGTIAYARMRRVDYLSGGILAAATIPGAILGALTTRLVPRHWFDAILGSLMVASSLYIAGGPRPGSARERSGRRGWTRRLVEADGTMHEFSYSPALGIGISVLVGYVSSLLGIGGGIIHVPVLASLLGFPIHVATATSHFTLAVMSLTGTLVHVAQGTFVHGLHRTAALAVGVLVGAQAGAWLSGRMHGARILRLLALALFFVGLRLLWGVFRPPA